MFALPAVLRGTGRFRGHDADFTHGLWPHVCKAEDQYIKTFKNRANLVLDTSFSCEVGIWEYYIDQLTASANAGRMADLRSRFAHFVPINAALIPQKSMLRSSLEPKTNKTSCYVQMFTIWT